MVSNTIFSIVMASALSCIVLSVDSHLIVLETEEDVQPSWTIQSSYLGNMSETEDENGDEICKPPKMLPDSDSVGFWSTCQERRLIIKFSCEYPLNPISLTVISYLEGRQYLDITAYEDAEAEAAAAGEQIARIAAQSWNSTTSEVDLGFIWTSNSLIVFETTVIPNNPDFIDRIEIEFPDLPTPTEPSTSAAETSTSSTEYESPTTQAHSTTRSDDQEETDADATAFPPTPAPAPTNEISGYWLRFIIYFLAAIIVFLLFTIVAIILINSRKAKIVSDADDHHHEQEVRRPEWVEGSSTYRIPLPRIDWSNPRSRFY